ncbi:sulfur carrier protein ThiS [Agilicoccus flavus]|uniref:sulfur carrier protein ThiS n=1 Tax=Agilicoccus flavus TaxID=2775968 RepID=UPI0027DA327F|nr:sulfur carrier protein ThiS [Agilicoccus flavus]
MPDPAHDHHLHAAPDEAPVDADPVGAVRVHVNDEPRTVATGTTCRDLVADLTGRAIGDDGRPLEGPGLGSALAVDGEVVPRGAWALTPLTDGARLEFVTAVQGG